MDRPPKSKAIERLQKALDSIPELKQLDCDSSDFVKWRRNTRIAITKTFGDKSYQKREFGSISYVTDINPTIALLNKSRTKGIPLPISKREAWSQQLQCSNQ